MSTALLEMDRSSKQRFPAQPEEIRNMRAYIAASITRALPEFDPQAEWLGSLLLACSEAATNVVRYAYPQDDEEGEVVVMVLVESNSAEVWLKHWGTPAPHLGADSVASVSASTAIADLPEAGLGFLLIHASVELFEQHVSDDGTCALRLVKYF